VTSDTGATAAMTYRDHIERCNRHDFRDRVPWAIDGAVAGYVTGALARRLADESDVFARVEDGLALADHLGEPANRTRAVAEVLDRLRCDGLIAAQRDEEYSVRQHIGGGELMRIDRSAAEAFGVLSTGFHLNGVRGRGDDVMMWIARRAPDRPSYPGALDNMVAGGQPAGLTLVQNLVKECLEEADIPAGLALSARPAGLVSYTMGVPGGLRRHVMYVYDLAVPDTFTPRPHDGEVEEFMLRPIHEVAGIVRTSIDSFKYNCNLVIIDFLIRHGFITPDDPDYPDLVIGLRRPPVDPSWSAGCPDGPR